MRVLVLNVGSSSLKAAVLEATTTTADRLWETSTKRINPVEKQLQQWLTPQLQPWLPQLNAAVHRLVHGGEHFTSTTRISAGMQQQLARLDQLAPLHNPAARSGMGWLQQLQPKLEQWACFDTAFHATLPEPARTYALPAPWRQQGYRRYGFHGLNHQHVMEQATEHWQTAGHSDRPRLISVHLGAGCSLCAIRKGKSIDTSMGFTPLEGLVMASRSGSVDPGLLLLLQKQGLSLTELETGLNQHSGLLGLSELSDDWQELKAAAAQGHGGARLARAVFQHRLRQGIGAMAASLNGVDQIALSGGIGANDAQLLSELQASMSWLGAVQWLQIPADEEGMMARLMCRASAGAN